MERHQHSLSGESTTSAVDLSGTPAGIGSSVPPSPSLIPTDNGGSFTRRRLSWGRMETTHDPLRFDLPDAEPRTSTPQRMGPVAGPAGWASHDDPFFSPTEEDSPTFNHAFSYRSAGGGTYTTAQPGPSSASLISSAYRNSDPSVQDDDELALTANMSRPGTSSGWRAGIDADPERSASTTRSKRTTRYSTSPSPLRKAGNRLTTISRNLRRASVRVVNMAGIGIEEHVRLADVDDEKEAVEDDEDDEKEKEYVAAALDPSKTIPIRGKTMGFMGPRSRVRLAMYKFLIYP